jgi:hypothetical protein
MTELTRLQGRARRVGFHVRGPYVDGRLGYVWELWDGSYRMVGSRPGDGALTTAEVEAAIATRRSALAGGLVRLVDARRRRQLEV